MIIAPLTAGCPQVFFEKSSPACTSISGEGKLFVLIQLSFLFTPWKED